MLNWSVDAALSMTLSGSTLADPADDAHASPRPPIRDVWVVPISISYDQTLETPGYVQEALGQPKPKVRPKFFTLFFFFFFSIIQHWVQID
jgi:hypothetical protein